MVNICEEYYLVELGGIQTPVRHKYTNLTDEWYGPDGSRYEDPSVIADIASKTSEESLLKNNVQYQKLIDIYNHQVLIKEDLDIVKGDLGVIKGNLGVLKEDADVLKQHVSDINSNVDVILEEIGDIKVILDYINGGKV